jgi:hypothetical protein
MTAAIRSHAESANLKVEAGSDIFPPAPPGKLTDAGANQSDHLPPRRTAARERKSANLREALDRRGAAEAVP